MLRMLMMCVCSAKRIWPHAMILRRPPAHANTTAAAPGRILQAAVLQAQCRATSRKIEVMSRQLRFHVPHANDHRPAKRM
jgi:hypothetical protein